METDGRNDTEPTGLKLAYIFFEMDLKQSHSLLHPAFNADLLVMDLDQAVAENSTDQDGILVERHRLQYGGDEVDLLFDLVWWKNKLAEHGLKRFDWVIICCESYQVWILRPLVSYLQAALGIRTPLLTIGEMHDPERYGNRKEDILLHIRKWARTNRETEMSQLKDLDELKNNLLLFESQGELGMASEMEFKLKCLLGRIYSLGY